MWCRIFLVLLAGAVSAEHYQAWKTETEYQYHVQGRTLTALHDVLDEYTGIIYKALLTVHPKSEDTLEAKVSKAQYAQIQTQLADGWKSEISDHMLDFKQFPLSEKVFEIKIKHGVVRDLIVDQDVPTWEVNFLKSIVSQFQVDTQGENLIPSRYNQEPEENRVNAMYKTMEDTVGGKCEVMYDISPLPEFVLNSKPEWMPQHHYRGEGELIAVVKTKNYTNCEQRMSHHFGITGSTGSEPGTNDNGKFMSRSSISRIIITGDLKTFTIQSSVTTDKVVMSPGLHENQKGMVGSRVNVTLVKMGPVSSGSWSTPANPESTGNLVYSYNSPFAAPGENRRPGQFNNNARDSNERVRYANQKSQEDDDSSASKSSKSINSFESNEQQRTYWQPKPTLNEAPSTPLQPFFVGNRGKSIQKSSEIDAVAMAKSLASHIGSDLQNPSTISEEQTLEKFTILASILRTMNTQQYAEVQRELYQSSNEIDPHDESQSVRRSTWIAFRDAVAQAGTGPALVTIKNWIKEKKIKSFEAASVVGVLSKTARTPTPEYMDAFFELATMPETINQQFLNSTAIVTFAELIRYSQVNHESAHNRYPVHTFGRLSPKHNPAIFRDYMPYMAQQLKKSIENNEFAKSHVFIRALGNVAHPKILAIYEPYLEGKSPATTFQRLLMVFSMNKLASLRPRLARGVLYRIYQNTAESHEVRCAAVTFLVSTNPPADMLQRMAEFTNYDHSKHVNAAVKSAIESASELTRPESRDLATKARNVLSLLNKESYGFEYSKNYLIDYAVNEMNLAYRGHHAHIGSDDSFVPQAIYASMEKIYGDFKLPKSEFGAMVSSVKDLYGAWRQQYEDVNEHREQQNKIDFSPEKIAKLLKIQSNDNDYLEGAFWMRSKYDNKFFSFDKYSLQNIPNLLRKAADSLKDGRNFNMAQIENYDVTLSFPLESGFPFHYSMRVPTLWKVGGSAKAGRNNPESFDASVNLRIVYAVQVQGRLGFSAPFEHQQYIAGVNRNYQIYLPISVRADYDKSAKKITMKLEPIDKNEKFKIVHSSIVPYTSRYNILSMSPVLKNKETHILREGELWHRKSDIGSKTHGLNFNIQVEGVRASLDEFYDDLLRNNPLGHILFPLAMEKPYYYKSEVSLVPYQSSSQSIIMTGSFESLHDDSAKKNTMNRSGELKALAPKVNSKKLNDPERRKQLLKEAAAGIVAADAFAIDWSVDLPGQEPSQFLMTMAYANSKVDERSRGLVYSKINSGGTEREACATLESQSPIVFMFDKLMAEKDERPSRNFDIELRAGSTCEAGSKFRISGHQEQSLAYREEVKNLPSMLKCMKEYKRGTKSLEACRNVDVMLSTMDDAKMTIKFDPKDRSMKEDIARVMEMLSQADNAVTIQKPFTKFDDDTLQFSMNLSPFEDLAHLDYSSSNNRVVIPDVYLGSLASLTGNADPDFSITERLNMKLSDVNFHQHMCVVDHEWTTTFDKATYPINLGKCWYVAMTTYPKNNKYSGSEKTISENMKVTVLIRDAENEKKDVKFALGNTELKMTMVGDKIQATVDGKSLDFNEKLSYRHGNGDNIEFEVLQRPDGSVRLFSSKYDIDVIYYGQRVQIKASGKYRNDVRGLCGNYDGEPANDFTSPKDCILMKSDEFVASYAWTSDNCQGPALELSKKANEAVCHHKIVRPGNVVSDREAGRKISGMNNWGYHSKQYNDDNNDSHRNANKRCTTVKTKVIQENDQMCFSMRPVPTCASGCKANRTKPKVMPMYCMPMGASAQQMADRIKQGANPDLSQKEPSKKLAFDIPVGCYA